MSSETMSREFIPVPGGVKYEEIRIYDPARYKRRKVTIKSDFHLTQCSAYVSIWTEQGWKLLYEKSVHDTFLADNSNTGCDPDPKTAALYLAEADIMFAKANNIVS